MRSAEGIEMRSVSKVYPGEVKALTEVSFEVATGEAFGLLGPNGAGKTTAIGVLTSTVRPTSGTATVGGYDVVTKGRDARRVSGVVFQDSVVDAALTGRMNLAIHARLWAVPKERARTRTAELAEIMGLSAVLDRPVRTYSGGQRRRLEVARAVLGDPKVLFMDEPTVGLDPTIRHELWSLIRDLRADRGTTLLLTTHYLDEAERLCDRLAIVHRGHIVAMDSPQNLLRSLGDEVLEVEANGAATAVHDVLRHDGIPTDSVLQIGSLLTIPFRNGFGDRAARAVRDSNADVRSVALRRPTLDDVYLRLTGVSLAS